MTGPVRPALLLLLAGVGCLLLIACANAANLMLTRASARRVETAVRTALGAGRWHLLRLALAESALLAFAAEARMRQQPGVAAVGAASALPLSHEGSEMDPPYTVVGEPVPAPGDEPTALTTFVTPGYFDAIGMRLVQGRLLNDRDTATAPPVIVVNETMARHARDCRRRRRCAPDGLQDRPQPVYYIPIRQVLFGSVTFVVRTSGDPALAVPALQQAVWSINPVVSFAGVETMNGLLRETLAARRFTLTLLSAFSAVALMLAAIGLYGLVSFSVGQRTSEIGIRMALGAGVGAVLAMVMRQGMIVAAAGVAGGLIASAALMRYLSAMLFGVTSSDPVTFVTLAAVMSIVSALACYVPARRAARVDPLTAIRKDRFRLQTSNFRLQTFMPDSTGSGAFSTGSRKAPTCLRSSS